ncbi:MAG: DegT/DnrJ/EryC1/StrS family aminotransferase [Nanoarchaeota archaeon]|nr:DegT/DnrJ/EryC1/StrS family aminotransferase [Nanoarchaeota archaeon]
MIVNKIQVGDFKLGKEERDAIIKVLDSGRLSEGPKVREFEEEWAKFIGTKHSILTSSGTAAIMCGLSALKYHNKYKIKEGTNIITSPITYIATSNAIVLTNFKPVYVDIDRKTFNITPENIKEYLEKNNNSDCSVILPVHLMGYPCDMNKINKIAKQHGLVTFEDSAQAHGTIYEGKKTGALSLLSDFSFYIAHNIQAGEMGAITTDDDEINRLVRKIKTNGRMCDCKICVRATGQCVKLKKHEKENPKNVEDFDPRFSHDLIGYNFKTMEFQAALGLTQLKKAGWIIKKRQENVKYLNEGLEEFSDILQLPFYSNKISYLAYPLLINKPNTISRKNLRTELEKKNVETRPLFGCIPTQQKAYSYLKKEYENKLPNADYVGQNAFYIGCHQYLERNELDYVIKTFKEILGKRL